jgi:hypothetical protein
MTLFHRLMLFRQMFSLMTFVEAPWTSREKKWFSADDLKEAFRDLVAS